MHIFKSGLQNDFELLRILNYWSLDYRGSTVYANSLHFLPPSIDSLYCSSRRTVAGTKARLQTNECVTTG